ncbi:hypothetical protein I5M27_15935 [Adhaeribacter sp. BT258]|uniref:STAS/SEC14 domain-containing protein n=1 Tax=Adhaeribacter terrigena TaxID=2793070 RepID=A0ABS1C522_9BACT|nr:hypothetical protein [Adhaeribacter terrigena]MBK0404487.1 hypothetical protein [Adhaeribacter terrigena]
MEQSFENLLSLKTIPEEAASREHTLFFDEIHDCVISEWRGFVSKQLLITGAIQGLRLLKQHNCGNLLIDQRQVHGTWADLSDWQQHIWLPNALQVGLKKYALVATFGSYSALTMEGSFERFGDQLEIMLFSDLSEAKSWLAGF